jgi:hypothetical protein
VSSWLATVAAVSILKKKESPITPFKRTAELAEYEQKKALRDLEDATKELVRVVAERIPHDS